MKTLRKKQYILASLQMFAAANAMFVSAHKNYILKKYFCAFLLLLSLGGFAQQPENDHPYADSLAALLPHTTTDTSKAGLYFLLSNYWADFDSAKGVDYALQALQLPLDPYHKGIAYFYLGSAYFDYDIDKAEAAYKTAEKLFEAYHAKEALIYRSRAWANIGAIAQRRNKNREYIDILLTRAIPLAAGAGDSLRMARQYMEVGLPFMNYKDYDKAIVYYKKSIGIFVRHQVHSLTLADGYCNAAKAYLLNGQVQPAKPMLDSARAILDKTPVSVYHTYYYCQEGLYYTHTKEWAKAEESLAKGLALAKTQHHPRDVTTLLFGYVDLYTEQQNFPALKRILLTLYNDKVLYSLSDWQQLLLDLATTEKGLGNAAAAYDWLWKYSLMTDSLNKAQINFQLTELEAKYNFESKERELAQLSEKSKMQRWLLGVSIGLLLIAILLFTYFYKQRKIKIEQQLTSLRQQQQIAVAQALLQGEERERGRLARDLHDGLGGMLSGVKIRLSEIATDDNEPLKKAIRQLDNSVTELRSIARNLMPESLLRSGLETALKDLCQSVPTEKMNVELQVMNIAQNLPITVQIIIYRIVQELLTNVLKHAHATELFVQCSQLEDIFYITIEDNGKGFDVTNINDNKGIGLDNIRHRVEFLQGKIDISSSPQKGTVINIELLCRNN